MKKTLSIALTDEDLIELLRILADSDAQGALEFIQRHLKAKTREALEGG